MKRLMAIFVFFLRLVFAADYDCVIVGTSPISLFEAIYQHYLGNRVLVLEQAGECGGAWKSIDICGVAHVDLGCHQIGGDRDLKKFLEVYGGCKIVSMDQPSSPNDQFAGNFYFSQGCYELVRNLTKWMDAAGVVLLMNCRLDSVFIDAEAGHAVVKTTRGQFTAKKIFYTQMTAFNIENNGRPPHSLHTMKYPHLYLLVQDPTAPKFSYIGYGELRASRAMNLTHFVGLFGTGRQLIVFQLNGEDSFSKGQQYLDSLKKRNFVDSSAYLLRAEPYTYEIAFNPHNGVPSQFQPYFEMLRAGNFSSMSSYVPKWKQVLPRYRDAVPN